MPELIAEVADLETIDEAQRGFYARDGEDGPFVLQVGAVNGRALEDVGGLKRSLAASREESRLYRKLGSRLGVDENVAFEDFDHALHEKITGLVSQGDEIKGLRQKLEKGSGIKREDIEREVRATVTQQWEAKLDESTRAHTTELTGVRRVAEKSGIDDQVDKALLDAGATPATLALLRNEARARVRAQWSAGSDGAPMLSVDVLDEQGNPGVGGADSPKTLAELAEGLGKLYPQLYQSRGGSGAGGPGGKRGDGAGTGGGRPKHRGDFGSVEDKVRFIESEGREAFEGLPLQPPQ